MPARFFALSLLFFFTQVNGSPSVELENDGSVKVVLANTQLDIELLQFSTDLLSWQTIARDYGNGWELIQPYEWPIETTTSSATVEELNSVGKGFYRTTSNENALALSNSELAARFLTQCTFGPTLSEINNFTGLSDVDFADPPYTAFNNWIDAQINIAPFYHRAFFRKQSDPNFVDATNVAGRLPNEVEYDPTLGHRFNFFRGNLSFKPNWTCSLNGHGGVYDSNGIVIDASDHAGNLDSNGIPKIGSHIDDVNAEGKTIWDISYSNNDTKQYIWYHSAVKAEDQLRQRIAWLLSQYFVVGEEGSNHPAVTERWTNYYDIFVRNAFGNFKDILYEVTWSPHMAYYLSYLNNREANASAGTFPDENYAREVMQLFTIGLWELNKDGSLKKDSSGNPIPTYDNSDIEEFARVFTGLRLAAARDNIETFFGNYVDPLRILNDWHDFGAKTLLDGTTHGPFPETDQGVTDDINGLLDHLFEHSNTPTFFAKFFIQRLTVSNPSGNYIEAVADAFETGMYKGQGNGEPGDLVAVLKATLLHPEAREPSLQFDNAHGKLREPLIRLMHLSRVLNLESERTYEWMSFNKLEDVIFQAPYESPSVFNFYRPDYKPNGEINDQGLNAPEFQIHNDVSAIQLKNAYWTLTHYGIRGNQYGSIGTKSYTEASPSYTDFNNYTSNISELLGKINLVLASGRLDASTLNILETRLTEMNLSGDELIKKAIFLVSLTPQFNILH